MGLARRVCRYSRAGDQRVPVHWEEGSHLDGTNRTYIRPAAEAAGVAEGVALRSPAWAHTAAEGAAVGIPAPRGTGQVGMLVARDEGIPRAEPDAADTRTAPAASAEGIPAEVAAVVEVGVRQPYDGLPPADQRCSQRPHSARWRSELARVVDWRATWGLRAA
jgi:hypothetical protein